MKSSSSGSFGRKWVIKEWEEEQGDKEKKTLTRREWEKCLKNNIGEYGNVITLYFNMKRGDEFDLNFLKKGGAD